MSAPTRMHDDEMGLDADLVRRLLASQHPRWSSLPIERVPSEGTVKAIFRLGGDLAVRLPRIPRHQDDPELPEQLAALALQLPLAIPETVAVGEPPRRPHARRRVRGDLPRRRT